MKCPNCGSKLELVAAEDVTRFEIENYDDDDLAVELLFNCEKCTHDWRAVVIPDSVKLWPKFWG
jgi:transcription initiation factor IIE alpha subunit